MVTIKVKEEYDGRLPIFHVVKEVTVCDSSGVIRDQIIETFDTYEQAEQYCVKLIKEDKVKDNHTTPCGEEDPCNG